MREILFRGKDIQGNWFYGDLVHNAFDGCSSNIAVGIKKPSCYPNEVIPETVGQFTGLTDNNGVKVFEHDIVTFSGYDTNYTVCFEDGCFILRHTKLKDCDLKPLKWGSIARALELNMPIEAIGNIHDNPELLEV